MTMELLILSIIFILCNIGLYVWAKTQLTEKNNVYSTMFMRGTVRGYKGRFDTSSNLEQMRKRVNRKNSKF